MLIMSDPNYIRRSTLACIATELLHSWGGPYVGWNEIEKYKRFCICCFTPLKDKYSQIKTGRLTVVGEAFVTATQLSVAGK